MGCSFLLTINTIGCNLAFIPQIDRLMKTKIIFTGLFLVWITVLSAQNQSGINYQALIRNSAGEAIITQNILLRFSLVEGESGSVLYYIEDHDVYTSEKGMVSITLGAGDSIEGSFASIPWEEMNVYLQVELDENKSGDFLSIGSSKLNAVPYAFYAINIKEEDADPNNEIQELRIEGDTLFLSSSNHVLLPNDSSVWTRKEDHIYHMGKVGINSSNPGSSLEIRGDEASTETDTLFSVKDKNGNIVFAVYPDGAVVYVNEESKSKGRIGGFAVSGRTPGGKAIESEYFRVTPDSTRVWVRESSTKGRIGGFAVSGRTPGGKTESSEYLRVTPDSTRIWVRESNLKGRIGGFAVSGRTPGGKSEDNPYFQLNQDSARVYFEESTKGRIGGFAVSGRTPGGKSGEFTDYLNVTGKTDANIITPSEARVMWYPKREAFLTGRVRVGSVDSVGLNSTAMGFESVSMGNYSQAFGYQSMALGDYSTAIGYKALANANSTFAFGNQAKAKGNDSYAFGSGASAEGEKSFAFGSVGIDSAGVVTGNTIAQGDYSLAFGLGSQTQNIGAVSLGTQCIAYGRYSMAMGYQSYAYDYYSVAIGRKNEAVGSAALAIGSETNANGDLSFSMGVGSTAGGRASFAGGNSNTSGSYALAFGGGNSANGASSIALGTGNTATDLAAIALGYSVTANGEASIALGFDASNGNYDNSFVFSDGGGSTTTNTRANQFMVKARGGIVFYTDWGDNIGNSVYINSGNGNLGLGISSPSEKLHVNGNVRLTSFAGVHFNNSNTRIRESSGDLYLSADDDILFRPDDDVYFATGDNSTFWARFDNGNRRLGIGTTLPTDRLVVAGGRVEFTATTDASGTTGTGVLEIANSLRFDGNEIITNSNTPLYINCGNNSDVEFDYGTLFVDASTNRAAVGLTGSLSYKFTVLGSAGYYGMLLSNRGNSDEYHGLRVEAGTYGGSGSTAFVGCKTGDGSAHLGGLYNNGGTIYVSSKSDARDKNILRETVTKAMSIIEDLKVYDFEYKALPGLKKTGFVAQQAEKIYPEMVIYDKSEDAYMVAPAALIPMLTKALQEQQEIIEQQNKKQAELESRLNKLEELIGAK